MPQHHRASLTGLSYHRARVSSGSLFGDCGTHFMHLYFCCPRMKNSHSSYCPSKQCSSLCARKAQWPNLKEEFLLALTSINLMAKCHILKNASLSASCLIAFSSLDASAFSSFPRVICNFISKGLHYHFPGAQEFVKNSISSQCRAFSARWTIRPAHPPPRPSCSVPSSRQEAILAVSVQRVGLFLNSYMENTKRLQSEQGHTMVVFKQRNPQISQKNWSQKPWEARCVTSCLRASASLYAFCPKCTSNKHGRKSIPHTSPATVHPHGSRTERHFLAHTPGPRAI